MREMNFDRSKHRTPTEQRSVCVAVRLHIEPSILRHIGMPEEMSLSFHSTTALLSWSCSKPSLRVTFFNHFFHTFWLVIFFFSQAFLSVFGLSWGQKKSKCSATCGRDACSGPPNGEFACGGLRAPRCLRVLQPCVKSQKFRHLRRADALEGLDKG